jgi:hypothetical protein
MNGLLHWTPLIAVAAAGTLAVTPAFAQTRPAARSTSAARPPKHLVTFRGRVFPAQTESASGASCAGPLGAAPPRVVAFNAPPPQPIIVVPDRAFASGAFGSEVPNATAHAQLARACAK